LIQCVFIVRMNDGFSVSFVGLSLILLLWFCAVLITPCRGFFAELPITDNPEEFGSEDQHHYPIITIKADGSKYFENDWLPQLNVLSSKPSIQTSNFVFIRADARLSFGEVRKTLKEIRKYRTTGIVLMSEKKIIEKNSVHSVCSVFP
jgi:biopolymer transport protein ExbD